MATPKIPVPSFETPTVWAPQDEEEGVRCGLIYTIGLILRGSREAASRRRLQPALETPRIQDILIVRAKLWDESGQGGDLGCFRSHPLARFAGLPWK